MRPIHLREVCAVAAVVISTVAAGPNVTVTVPGTTSSGPQYPANQCGTGSGNGTARGNLAPVGGTQYVSQDMVVAFPVGDPAGTSYVNAMTQSAVSPSQTTSTSRSNQGQLDAMYQNAMNSVSQGMPSARNFTFATLNSQGAFVCNGLTTGMVYRFIATVYVNGTYAVSVGNNQWSRNATRVTRYYEADGAPLPAVGNVLGAYIGGWRLIGQNPRSIPNVAQVSVP